MRAILPNLPQIENLSKPLAESIQAFKASVAAWGDAEHNANGSHGEVTADSLAVTNSAVFGKINLRSVTFSDTIAMGGTVNDLWVEGIEAVSCLRILPVASPLQINGIDARGRERGDLLLVLNADYTLNAADVLLMMENTGSTDVNRFAETTASPTSVGGAVTINGARGVWLIYDYQERQATSNPLGGRWRVLDPSV